MLNTFRFATVLAVLVPAAIFAQVPVIPGAAGYGVNTPAGRGGDIFRVTNLKDDGNGSLRACVEASGPRVCVFETSGTIRLQTNLVVSDPKLTIAGQTAPAPGIMLRGASMIVKASDVLIQHIAVRAGDDPEGPAPFSRDSVKINGDDNPVRNVVIDHCSISWAIDENMSIFGDFDNITISNSIISEPLDDSQHSEGPHGYGVLITARNQNSKVSFIGNLFAHSVARNPRSNAAKFVFANNVMYNLGAAGVMLYNTSGMISDNSIVSNVFIDGRDTTASPVRIIGADDGDGNNEILRGSLIYLSDNAAAGAEGDQWSIVNNKSSVGEAALRSDSRPAWPPGLAVWPTGDDVALDRVLRQAGARPADRDRVDNGIVSDVRNGTGRIVNCVANDGTTRCQKNAGGWPNLTANTRALNVPSNPNDDGDGNGYTELEEWLHAKSAEVEGQASPELPLSDVPQAPVLQDSGF